MTENLSTNPALTQSYIESLAVKIRKPGGLSSLNFDERKFLLALLIAAVVPADSFVKLVELEKLNAILRNKYHVSGDTLQKTLLVARGSLLSSKKIQTFAKSIPELLSIEDRCTLIGQMWDVALCDQELHASEEALIFEVADAAGVPRKRVIEQQARAAAQS